MYLAAVPVPLPWNFSESGGSGWSWLTGPPPFAPQQASKRSLPSTPQTSQESDGTKVREYIVHGHTPILPLSMPTVLPTKPMVRTVTCSIIMCTTNSIPSPAPGLGEDALSHRLSNGNIRARE